MRTRQGLRAITPDIAGIKAYCLEADKAAQGFYPFTMDSPFDGTDFFARQFNPVADENEDPITGVAAGALGCYSKEHGLYDGRQTFVVAQGYDLKKDGKPMGGNMFVDVSHGVKVGGYAVIYDETRGGGLARGRE
jgi:PhzF family phenazine biosynthesis protein